MTVVEYGDFECPWTGMVAPTAWELLANQAHLDLDNVVTYASMLGLDTGRFRDELLRRRFAARVARVHLQRACRRRVIATEAVPSAQSK